MKGRRILKIILVVVIALAIAGYAIFQARKIIEGPQIKISSPTDGQTVSVAQVLVNGSAKNIAFLYLNNKKIYTNDDGVFHEITIVATGTNVLELKADDKFGNQIVQKITVYRDR